MKESTKMYSFKTLICKGKKNLRFSTRWHGQLRSECRMVIKRRPVTVFSVERNRTSGKSGQPERGSGKCPGFQGRACDPCCCSSRRQLRRDWLFIARFFARLLLLLLLWRWCGGCGRGSAAWADRLLLGVVASEVAVLLAWRTSSRTVLQISVLKETRKIHQQNDLAFHDNPIYLS